MNKKEIIIHAALEVFASQGLDKGKIADIAKQAGIGKGTIYEYFKSKDDIFKAIEDMFISDMLLQVQEIAQADDAPTAKIEKICRISLDIHKHLGDSVLIIAEIWAQHTRGQLHGHSTALFEEMYEKYYELVAGILIEGVQKREFRTMNIMGVTTVLLAMIDGIMWQSLIIKNDEQFNKRKTYAIESFMNGIKI